MPTLHLWHLAYKPLASQKEKRVPWGQAPPRRLRSSGRPEPDRQREWEDTLGDHIAKVQSHKGKTGEGPGTPGGHPLPSEGGPGPRYLSSIIQNNKLDDTELKSSAKIKQKTHSNEVKKK